MRLIRIALRRRLALLFTISMVLGSAAAVAGTSTASASSCNTVSTGSWSNNCQQTEGADNSMVYGIQRVVLNFYLWGDTSDSACDVSLDGDFGPATLAAVECFQSHTGLSVDGEVGSQTWAKLGSYVVQDSSSGDWYYYKFKGACSGCDIFRLYGPTSVWYVNENNSYVEMKS
jgi:zinc D-Ala-D-Ala carboxypeptidase